MRKNWIITVILTCIFSACTKSPEYTLNGDIENYTGKVYLVSLSDTKIIDTISTVDNIDGKFEMRGSVKSPTLAWICIDGVNYRIPILLENSSFSLSADAKKIKEFTLSGTGELQTLRNKFKAEIEDSINIQRDSLRKKHREASDFFERITVKNQYENLNQDYEEKENQFIRENNNLVSLSLVYERFKELSQNKKLSEKYNLLGNNVLNHPAAIEMAEVVEVERRITVGGIAMDFTMNDLEGKPVSLHQIKSKVKILDFWASWCGPCRAENPNMKNIYAKYHDKGLEIIAVSLDVDKKKWENAIKDDGLPWIHVSDLKGWDCAAAKLYKISGVPHMMLLDENNKILSVGLRGKELEDAIEDLLS